MAKKVFLPDCCGLIALDMFNIQIMVIKSLKGLNEFFKMNKFSKEKKEEYREYWSLNNGLALQDPLIGNIPHFIILLNSTNRRTIVHESVHMVHMVMDYCGIPIQGENTEIMAYMTDSIVESIYSIMDNE